MKKYIYAMILVVGAGLAFSGCASHFQTVSVVGSSKCATGGKIDEGAVGTIRIVKSMPRKVVAGKPLEYTITATNLCECTLAGVVITEKFSGAIEAKSTLPAAKVTAEGVEWEAGSLKSRERKTLTVTGIAKVSGAFETVTEAVYNLVPCNEAKAALPRLKIVLEAPDKAVLCDTIPVKWTITNQGTARAKNVTVSQDLPKGIETADHKILFTELLGDLAGGASRSLIVELKAQKAGRYVHTASVATVDGFSAVSSPVTTEVLEPSLKVGIEGPEKVLVGKNADYKVSVQSTGNTDATGTMVVAALPPQMQFVSASNGGKVSGKSIVWDVGKLGVGKQIFLSATLKAIKAGTSESVVSGKGACCKEASAKLKTEVTGIPAIRLEVTDTEDPIQVGGTEKFLVVVTNQGSASDKNIVVKVSFEEHFDYVGATGPTQGKSESGKSVEFAPLGSLEPGQKVTWEVKAKAVSEGDHLVNVGITCESIRRPAQETEVTRIY
ncbi:MAG: hypothetical protein V1882_10375 [Candidatus Omnitrophota bacterium]